MADTHCHGPQPSGTPEAAAEEQRAYLMLLPFSGITKDKTFFTLQKKKKKRRKYYITLRLFF